MSNEVTNETDGKDIELIENCQVEWDKRRGVLYVHNKDTGASVVRIANLPPCHRSIILKTAGNMVDVWADYNRSSTPGRT